MYNYYIILIQIKILILTEIFSYQVLTTQNLIIIKSQIKGKDYQLIQQIFNIVINQVIKEIKIVYYFLIKLHPKNTPVKIIQEIEI